MGRLEINGTHSQLQKKIEKYGGKYLNNITKQINYVIVPANDDYKKLGKYKNIQDNYKNIKLIQEKYVNDCIKKREKLNIDKYVVSFLNDKSNNYLKEEINNEVMDNSEDDSEDDFTNNLENDLESNSENNLKNDLLEDDGDIEMTINNKIKFNNV